jgi:hypothetical protein
LEKKEKRFLKNILHIYIERERFHIEDRERERERDYEFTVDVYGSANHGTSREGERDFEHFGKDVS